MLNHPPALLPEGRQTSIEETKSLKPLTTGWLASGWAVIAARHAETALQQDCRVEHPPCLAQPRRQHPRVVLPLAVRKARRLFEDAMNANLELVESSPGFDRCRWTCDSRR
ncbi:MAG: hypothetical protein AB7P33_00265 [Dehalococcoidia bacterium]